MASQKETATRIPASMRAALAEWLARLLRGEPGGWPIGDSAPAVWAAEAFFRAENTGPLCLHALGRAGLMDGVPPAVTQLLRRDARRQAALALVRRELDVQVIERLAAIGLRPLVLKGAAYGHLLYPEPHLRPRCDTDLLFPDRPSAEAAWTHLAAEGYTLAPNVVEGRYVSRQRTCVRPGGGHALDIHWSISNTHTFNRALPYPELERDAQPLPALHPEARTLGPVHGLLYACLHYFGHDQEDRGLGLLWLYDILLLGRRLTERQWETFARQAVDKGVAGICRQVLDQVAAWFPAPAPQHLRLALARAEAKEHFRPARLTSPLRYQYYDLRALDGWRARAGWVRETFLPSAAYMRAKYTDAPVAWLPLLYLHRSATGLARRLRASRR